MAFDHKGFERAKFQHRTDFVPVPTLASFFDEGEEAKIQVRGLTGEEMALANEAQSRASRLREALEALAGNNKEERVEAIREAVGLGAGDEIPADAARRIEVIRHGCIDPSFDEQQASKLMRVSCLEAYSLSNKILELSGQGMSLGEPAASGGTPESKQAST